MKRVLVTFALGEHTQLLELALPGFHGYADRHGYDLFTAPPRMLTRPASWGKVAAILSAFDRGYQEVLWVDADVVVLDDSVDVADEVGPDDWHAITLHRTVEGDIPSCGVWLCRPKLRPALEQMWRLTRYLHHPWWEQAALHEVLGYGGTPVRRLRSTELAASTCWLDPQWHTLRLEYPQGPEADGRFVHCAPGSRVGYRAELMRNLTGRSLSHAQISADEGEGNGQQR